ncbi:D-2-hydroxyacid dehydrogenase [Rhodopila sp.]|uniref:D-2-hydroxyacid dehydrogenase n=1 Tax=Rhodopila sp. TaxID=2480087 RepID=UPI003D1200A5
MRNLPRLLLWTDASNHYADAIAAAGLSDRVLINPLSREAMPSDAQRAETNVLLAAGVPPGLLATLPKLRWAQSLTAGVEGWLSLPDLSACITLTCARGTHRQSMPENILGALFHIAKPYAGIAEDQRQSLWRHRVATPLNGKTLGILGLGAIGQDVARLASALDMRVIGTRRRPAPIPGVAEVLASERTPEVLAQSDFVLLLLPATPETENFIDAERLARMKPSAWLLNFGRGHLIDDHALVAAVTAKQIAGAILDVFRQEPLPKQHPFWTTEGILVLPHIGGPHPDRDSIVAGLFVENLQCSLNDQPLTRVVDRTAYY